VRIATRLDPEDTEGVDLVIVDARDVEASVAPELVQRYHPGAGLVVLAVAGRDADIVAWAERGVAGILTDDDDLAELDSVGMAVSRGQAACSGLVAGVLLQQFRQRTPAPHPGLSEVRLTPREQEVLALIELGWSNKQIARHLGIEIRTVKNHVHNLLDKLRVSRRAEAAQWRVRDLPTARAGSTGSPPHEAWR
jgi:DNA-binding NarL/FixJ family response regulator